MGSLGVSGIIFACLFAGAWLGLFLRSRLPEHHLSAESKDVVKLTMGLIGAMTALVLGLLISSAKSSFDLQRNGVSQLAANALVMDRALAHYGKETQETRELLRAALVDIVRQTWPDETQNMTLTEVRMESERLYQELYERIVALEPKNDVQRRLQSRTLQAYGETGQLRWQLFAQRAGNSIPTPFLVVLVIWLVLLLVSFALYAPRNTTTVLSLGLCALAVSSAIFLILELDRPFHGIIRISSEPLHSALERMGR